MQVTNPAAYYLTIFKIEIMYVTEKEKDDLLAVWDLIGNVSDGADDFEYYQGLQSSMMNLFKKAKEDCFKRTLNKEAKRLLKKLGRYTNI